jgi:hypothetical protein
MSFASLNNAPFGLAVQMGVINERLDDRKEDGEVQR